MISMYVVIEDKSSVKFHFLQVLIKGQDFIKSHCPEQCGGSVTQTVSSYGMWLFSLKTFDKHDNCNSFL